MTSKIVWKPILVQFSRLDKCTYTEIGLYSVVRNICRLVQLRWRPTDSEFLMKERVDIVSKILPRYLNLSCEKNIRHKLLFKVEQFTYILKHVWRVGIFALPVPASQSQWFCEWVFGYMPEIRSVVAKGFKYVHILFYSITYISKYPTIEFKCVYVSLKRHLRVAK